MATGTLFVVATPIGNVDDISLRAQKVLAAVAVIAAEDTRHTGVLLKRLGISNRLVSVHEHNEAQRVPEMLAMLESGQDVALVSDAGTPLVSDPGFRLVAAAAAAGLRISPVPGCSAVLAALAVAGLPTDRFHFEGFLPATRERRRRRLQELGDRPETLVFFESVHRVGESLADMVASLGAERQAMAARELTKLHETLYRGTLADLLQAVTTVAGADKGEYTLVVAGAAAASRVDPVRAELDRTLQVLLGYMGVRQAADAAAKLLGQRKNEAYRRALELRESSDGNY